MSPCALKDELIDIRIKMKIEPKKIKTIHSILEYRPIQPELQNFIRRVADYTVSPLYSVFRLVTRVRDLAAQETHKRLIYKGKV